MKVHAVHNMYYMYARIRTPIRGLLSGELEFAGPAGSAHWPNWRVERAKEFAAHCEGDANATVCEERLEQRSLLIRWASHQFAIGISLNVRPLISPSISALSKHYLKALLSST